MILLAALAAGYSYAWGQHLALDASLLIAWKGLGVGLLALWAARQGRTTGHRLLAAVLALGAIADMVLERHFVAGACCFVLGHVAAITLYLRNRRQGKAGAAMAFAALWTMSVAGLSAWLAGGDPLVGVYALFLGAMSAAAILSRFPLAAAGALLFVVSDLLIFARLGGRMATGGLVWPIYFTGQALVAWGVARALPPQTIPQGGPLRSRRR